jgi:hypothetical protein
LGIAYRGTRVKEKQAIGLDEGSGQSARARGLAERTSSICSAYEAFILFRKRHVATYNAFARFGKSQIYMVCLHVCELHAW